MELGGGGKTGMHIGPRSTRSSGVSRTVHGDSYNRRKLSNLLPMQCFDHKDKRLFLMFVYVCFDLCLVLPIDSRKGLHLRSVLNCAFAYDGV